MVKTKSELEYYERVKKYVDLTGINTRGELTVVLQKAGLLGKVRTYKQINIIADELLLSVRGKPKEYKKYTTQTFYRGKKSRIIYRDKKTGRFIKKQE